MHSDQYVRDGRRDDSKEIKATWPITCNLVHVNTCRSIP